jgi:hypothetical protein
VAVGLAALLLPRPVSAQTPVVVEEFDGAGGPQVRRAAVRALSSRTEVGLVPLDEARRVASQQGGSLDEPATPKRVAEEFHVAAYVEGVVARRGGRWATRIRVRQAGDGPVLGQAVFRSRRPRQLPSRVRRGLWTKLASAFEQAASGSAESRPRQRQDTSSEPKPDAAESEPPRESSHTSPVPVEPQEREPSAVPSPLDVSAGVRGFSRKFEYTDDLFGKLRNYRLGLAPALTLRAEWYPGAHFTNAAGAHFGLGFRYAHSLAVESARQSGGPSFPTRMRQWNLAARGRIPLGAHELALTAGYGRYSFTIGPAAPAGPREAPPNVPGTPDVDYEFASFGGEGRFELGRGLSLRTSLGWLQVFSFGDLGSDAWFPRVSGNGFELQASLGYGLTPGLSIRGGFGMRRFFMSMQPRPGDRRVAGGAVDQSLWGHLGLAYRMQPGSP